VVSPANARHELAAFIESAQSRLLIYDPTISDPAMYRLLEQRAKAGVEIRILGRVTLRSSILAVNKPPLRLHVRAMVADGTRVFIGSQSLRRTELDARREIGIICADPRIASRLTEVFEEDWKLAEQAKEHEKLDDSAPASRVAKKVAKAVAKDLAPVAPVLKVVIRELTGDKPEVDLSPEEVEDSVRHAVKAAVRKVVQNVIEDAEGADEETKDGMEDQEEQAELREEQEQDRAATPPKAS
jgi:hypothetical protein